MSGFFSFYTRRAAVRAAAGVLVWCAVFGGVSPVFGAETSAPRKETAAAASSAARKDGGTEEVPPAGKAVKTSSKPAGTQKESASAVPKAAPAPAAPGAGAAQKRAVPAGDALRKQQSPTSITANQSSGKPFSAKKRSAAPTAKLKSGKAVKTAETAHKPVGSPSSARKKAGSGSPASKGAKAPGTARSAALPQGAPAVTAVRTPKFPASLATPVSEAEGARLPVAETWMPLVRRLAKDGVEMSYLRQMFGRMGDAYSHEPMGAKVKELFTSKFVPRPPRAPSAKPPSPPPVYRSMITPESIAKCRAYLAMHAPAFTLAETRYGVPKEVVVGLLMVETRLGTFLGHNSSFWSLACMAAAETPDRVDPVLKALPLPMTPDKDEWLQKVLRERSAWAYKELLALIRHSAANGLDPLGMPGSAYGAVGICQFMPSNLPKFAVDGDGDGRADLFVPADAIASVANYLKEHGWSGTDWMGKDRGGHHTTLKRYNKSNVYANTILAIADALVPAPAVADGKAVEKPGSGTKKSPRTARGAKAGRQAAAGKKGPAAAGKTGEAGTRAVSGAETPQQNPATPGGADTDTRGLDGGAADGNAGA